MDQKSAGQKLSVSAPDDRAAPAFQPSERFWPYADLPEEPMRIGEILVKCGALTQDELDASLARQQDAAAAAPQTQTDAPAPLIGEVLVESRLLQPEIVEAAAAKQKQITEKKAREARLIRVMPNTPALVLEGVTAIARTEGLDAGDLETAEALFRAVGRVVVLDEDALDAVTGLSGSGPAYVAIVVESLADGGVRMGLDRATAMTLAVQTVLGSAMLIRETGVHPGQLKDMVASPGGTTIAGIAALEEGGARWTFISAVEKATERSRQLGRS